MEEPKLDAKVVDEVSSNENKTEKSDQGNMRDQSESNESVEEIKKKATLLFLQGKRCIYIKDYAGALEALSESCMLFSKIYPEQDEALADPYFYYGKALLEVGRNESEVLGDQIQEDNDDDSDNDEEEEEQGGDDDDNDDDDDDESEEKNLEEAKDQTTEENGVEKQASENNEGSEMYVGSSIGEINDLQLSWEHLELAKLIYLKKADTCKETAIKLAETYLCLGENGLESENYSTAIEDIKQALELQKKHLSKEDRRIAETHYQLGIAYALDQNYEEAIKSFKNAIEQLEIKISSLNMRKKIGDKKTAEEEKDAFYTMDGEINEITNLIKEIEEKIKDMTESKNRVKAEIMKQIYGQSGASTSADVPQSEPSSSVVAKDISHLVKRKRKSDESEGGNDKKMKTND